MSTEQETWLVAGEKPPAPAPVPKRPRRKPRTTRRSKAPLPAPPVKEIKGLIRELEDAHQFNLLEEILDLYEVVSAIPDIELRTKRQWQILKEMLAYCYPKLKVDDSKDTSKTPVQINFNISPEMAASVNHGPAKRIDHVIDVEPESLE